MSPDELPFSHCVQVPGFGELWFWKSQGFYAICKHEAHKSNVFIDGEDDDDFNPNALSCERCVKFRCANKKGMSSQKSGSGRPLGFLLAWLQEQLFHQYAHHHKTNYTITLQDRQAARACLKNLPGSLLLLRCERARDISIKPPEPEEPQVFN